MPISSEAETSKGAKTPTQETNDDGADWMLSVCILPGQNGDSVAGTIRYQQFSEGAESMSMPMFLMVALITAFPLGYLIGKAIIAATGKRVNQQHTAEPK